MIGYKHWATILTLANKNDALRLALVTSWMTAAPAIALATEGLMPGEDDRKMWEKYFAPALKNRDAQHNPICAQLFYGLKGEMPKDAATILQCPNDCITRDELNAIAGIILGLIDEGDTRTALTTFGRSTIWYGTYKHHTNQLDNIIAHIGPGPMKVDIVHLLGCDEPVS